MRFRTLVAARKVFLLHLFTPALGPMQLPIKGGNVRTHQTDHIFLLAK
jgi:hypothetical protein